MVGESRVVWGCLRGRAERRERRLGSTRENTTMRPPPLPSPRLLPELPLLQLPVPELEKKAQG